MRIVIDTEDHPESPLSTEGAAQTHPSQTMINGGGAPSDAISRSSAIGALATINAGSPPAHLIELFEALKGADLEQEEKPKPQSNPKSPSPRQGRGRT